MSFGVGGRKRLVSSMVRFNGWTMRSRGWTMGDCRFLAKTWMGRNIVDREL